VAEADIDCAYYGPTEVGPYPFVALMERFSGSYDAGILAAP
jgi:hypothetical protein